MIVHCKLSLVCPNLGDPGYHNKFGQCYEGKTLIMDLSIFKIHDFFVVYHIGVFFCRSQGCPDPLTVLREVLISASMAFLKLCLNMMRPV